MRPDPEAIGAALTGRMDLEAFYFCGPFDASGEPASPDVHILAISRGDLVTDLHFVPGVSRFERRLEVSVVPLGVLRPAVEEGISSWFMFYTVDKLRTGRPVLESPRARGLREKALQSLRIRPSLYAEAIRGVVPAGGHASHLFADEGPGATPPAGRGNLACADSVPGVAAPDAEQDRPDAGGTLRAAALSGRLLSLLALHAIVKSGRTFSRHSDLLSDGSSLPVTLLKSDRPEARRTLGATTRVVERLLGLLGIDPARLAPAEGWTDLQGAAQ